MLNLINRGNYKINNIRENSIDFDIIDKVCNDITTETLHDVGQLMIGRGDYHIANIINSNVFLQDEIIWFEYKKSKFIIDKNIRLEDCRYIIINKNPIMRFIMIPDFNANFDIIRSVSSSSVARTSYNRFITFFINESIYNDNVNESNLVNLLIHIIDEIIMFNITTAYPYISVQDGNYNGEQVINLAINSPGHAKIAFRYIFDTIRALDRFLDLKYDNFDTFEGEYWRFDNYKLLKSIYNCAIESNNNESADIIMRDNIDILIELFDYYQHSYLEE